MNTNKHSTGGTGMASDMSAFDKWIEPFCKTIGVTKDGSHAAVAKHSWNAALDELKGLARAWRDDCFKPHIEDHLWVAEALDDWTDELEKRIEELRP